MNELPEAQRFALIVAEHLKFHRLKRGLSKLALAQRSGLDQRTITFIEDGVNIPSLATLFAICQGLEVDVARIVNAASKGKSPK